MFSYLFFSATKCLFQRQLDSALCLYLEEYPSYLTHIVTSIMDIYFLPSPGLKTDLFCYLVFWVQGGIYADLDTWAIEPIDDGLPEQLKAVGTVRAVIALEWGQMDSEPLPGFGDEPSYITHMA